MPIKNMGSSTMRFKEGLYITGSVDQTGGQTLQDFSLINSGSARFEGTLITTGSKSNKYMSEILNAEGSAGHGLLIRSYGNGSGTFLLDVEGRDGKNRVLGTRQASSGPTFQDTGN